MTTGQLVFYSGVALLAATVLLAIVFIVKKPQYIPEQAQAAFGPSGTQKLRNGYPTAPVTKEGKDTRREANATELIGQGAAPTELISPEAAATELMSAAATELMEAPSTGVGTEELQ